MWAEDCLFYHIYPLGMCGAPRENDGVHTDRILRVIEWIPHLKRLGAGAVYFSPLFESDRHGYDTRDYFTPDCRLGSREALARVCRALHENGIRVVLDGVFNHVGRGFAPFRDVCEKKWDSRYRDWFHLSFDGDTPYHDGFWYDCWEGHYELVKLNLQNPEVRQYLFDALRDWVNAYDIDGVRLDVAYCLDRGFLEELSRVAHSLKEDFFLFGEVLFGDYNLLVRQGMLDSCTNYENYKSLYSAFNSRNLFELSYSLNRQFGGQPWCIYRGKHLVTFLDNHDVSRIATQLNDKELLPVAWGVLFTMPGIPTVYYGSEWGMEGDKQAGDDGLRPAVEAPEWNALTDRIAALAAMRRENPVFSWGGYTNLAEGNEFALFERAMDGARAVVGVNIGAEPRNLRHGALCGAFRELQQNSDIQLNGELTLAPKSITVLLAQ